LTESNYGHGVDTFDCAKPRYIGDALHLQSVFMWFRFRTLWRVATEDEADADTLVTAAATRQPSTRRWWWWWWQMMKTERERERERGPYGPPNQHITVESIKDLLNW